jgi:choline/glycine/proline betaine transport protein
VVFPGAAGIIVAIVLTSIVASDWLTDTFTSMRVGISTNFGWLMILTMAVMLGVAVFLAATRYGGIKLGPDDSGPDFSTGAWFAMLFSAGMGIGLVFFGAAEGAQMLLNYEFLNGAVGEGGYAVIDAADATDEAKQQTMLFVFHHWGFSPWAVYAIVGLGLAYFGFRREMPMTIRSLFRPLLGDRVNGPVGHVIDIVAVVATIFGIATSLGLGASQVAAGLGRVFDVDLTSNLSLVLIIAVITALATVSVVSGLDKGIKFLSQYNIVAAAALAVAVLLAGPTLLLVSSFVDNTGHYIQNMIQTLAFTGAPAGEAAETLIQDWTVFYWAWWISWAPFVGMFIARISRGRTIREFVLAVLVAPTMVSFAWFTIFGTTTLEDTAAANEAGQFGAEDTAMFALLEGNLLGLPGGVVTALSLLTVMVVVVFFITSSDSGSFVVDMITSGGKQDPAVATRVFWAVSEGAIAAVILVAAGDAGLSGLQAGAVAAGLPFAILLLLAAWSLVRGLRQELPPRARTGIPPVTVPAATRAERAARELELRERELDQRERELDIREAESNLGTTTKAKPKAKPSPRRPRSGSD